MTAHAKYSPSSSEQWIGCPGSLTLAGVTEDRGSVYAEEGTAAHDLAATALEEGKDVSEYKGNIIKVGKNDYEVTDEMVKHVQTYVDYVLDNLGDGTLMIEQQVSLAKVLDLPDQFGTADAVILRDNEIHVVDLKYGRGVEVHADNNKQLMLYALGALDKYKALGDFDRIRVTAHQPRLYNVSEWDCSIEDLQEFGREAKNAVKISEQCVTGELNYEEYLNPGDKTCRWCPAKHKCPALAAQVTNLIADDFVDIQNEDKMREKLKNGVDLAEGAEPSFLSNAMKNLDIVELWVKSIKDQVYKELVDGGEVDGFKLVRGREGNRRWVDVAEVEDALKGMKLKRDQMYKTEVISPTAAEDLLKRENPVRWAKLQEYITRSEGKLSVAKESSSKPAVLPGDLEDTFGKLGD